MSQPTRAASVMANHGPRFMTQYAPKLYIFDESLDPNGYHSNSPLLFWTIVAVGARRYSKDPTVFSLLRSRVLELVQSTILSQEDKLCTIQAFLLLCIWPMPVNTMFKDISPLLAGAMINLAVSVGLHVDGVGQDFSRTTLRYDDKDRVFRAGLWISCMVASQR
jgi:transcriptional regulatory protein LEU3